MNLSDVVSKLSDTSSLKEKISILESCKGKKIESELVFYFWNALSDDQFHMKSIPQYIPIGENDGFSESFASLLNDLRNLTITGNNARKQTAIVLSGMNEAYASLACNILLKDPKCGVSTKTFRKVFSFFPEKPKLCKANSFSEKTIRQIHYPAFSQCKADGARVLIFTGHGAYEPRIFSSNGKNITQSLPSLMNFVKDAFPREYIIDGELLFLDDQGKVMERKTGNGLVSKCIKGTLDEGLEKNARIKAWDLIPECVYNDPDCKNNIINHPYKDRLEKLEHILLFYDGVKKKNEDYVKYVSVIETKLVYGFSDAFDHFHEMVKNGEEGTILKNTDFKWEGKRLKDCCKFKIAIQSTLRVVDFKYGDQNSKYSGMLGALTCESSDGIISVNVGSGFTDEERRLLTPENTIGRCIEVVHNGVISNVFKDHEEYSLFLPRFVEFRVDKDEADSFKEIKATATGSNILVKTY